MRLPGWVGALGIFAWVWYWDSHHETITEFFRRHPLLGVAVFTHLWSHIVLDKPRKVLIFR